MSDGSILLHNAGGLEGLRVEVARVVSLSRPVVHPKLVQVRLRMISN